MTATTAENQAILEVMQIAAERYLSRKRDKNGKIGFVLHSLVGDDSGRTDFVVKFPTGTKWLVEVAPAKSMRTAAAWKHKAAQAIRFGDEFGATPVVAKCGEKDIEFISARTGRALAIPATR